MRIPIRIRQAPQFVRQVWQRRVALHRQPQRTPTFRLCYFSCHSYFAYLYCAIHSLTLAAPDVKIEVLVFNDNDMPISDAQADTLRALMPGLRVIPWPKSMGWGAEQIGWIWKAYAVAAEGLQDDDIVARVDSDVFFFNDRIFKAVAGSDADFIGDGHFVDFAYCQGGNYYLRAGAIHKVLALLDQHGVDPLVRECTVQVEDVAAQHFAQRAGLRIWMTYFMMFPQELRNASALTAWQRWKFSCLHFVFKNKGGMLDAYRQEVLPSDQQAAFATALATT